MANVIKHKRGSGSDPGASDLILGELAIRTDTGKLFTKMDSGAIAEIAGGGSDIAINTLSSSSATGGGSATFNGSAYRFTLSAPPNVSAAQLLVSINGVIQKPVPGTGQPSEGFSVDGTDIILGDAPATGSDFFILTFKSLGVSEPADNSVTSAKIVDGAIVNADINASAAIAGTKISPDFGSQTVTTTGTVNTGLINASSASDQILNLNSSDNGAVYLAFKRSGGRKAYFGYGGTGNTISLANEISDGDIVIAGNDGGSNINMLSFNTSENGRATFVGNVNVGAGIDVTGAITGTGDVTITKASPVLRLADTTDPQGTDGSIGKIEFYGNDGSSGGADVRSFIQTISTNSVGNAHALIVGLGESNAAPTERMRLSVDELRLIRTTTNAKITLSRNEDVDADNAPTGVIDFANNTAHTVNSRIQGVTDGTNNVGGQLLVETRDPANSTLTEKFRIKGNGNVGIGTSSPDSKLHVSAISATAQLRLTRSNAAANGNDYGRILWESQDDVLTGKIAVARETAENNGYMHFSTASGGTLDERMRIDSSGNVGIGDTSPDAPLVVRGSASAPHTVFRVNSQSESTKAFIQTVQDSDIRIGSDSNHPLNLYSNSLARVTITEDGEVLIGGISSPNTFNGVGGVSNLVVAGSTADTDITDNSGASLTISNTDGTANNTAGLHFAREDTDGVPHYSGASVVAQFKETMNTGQYPKADLAFLTSSANNNAPSEKMRLLSSGGLTFNGDSSSANALNDYEEGSWTPTAFYGSGSFSAVNNAVCRYVKVGSLVQVSGRFSLTGGGSGELKIEGLPFAKGNPSNDGNSAGIQIYVEGAASNISNGVVGLVLDATTVIFIRRNGTTASGNDMAGLVDGGTTLLIGGTYNTVS